MKRHHHHGNSYKKITGVGLKVRGLVYYPHGRKHGSVQADKVLEELRVLHMDLKAAQRDRDTWPGLNI